jgi:hypothetical protein
VARILADTSVRTTLVCLLELVLGAAVIAGLAFSYFAWVKATGVRDANPIRAASLAVMIVWVLSVPALGSFLATKLGDVQRSVVLGFAVVVILLGVFPLYKCALVHQHLPRG